MYNKVDFELWELEVSCCASHGFCTLFKNILFNFQNQSINQSINQFRYIIYFFEIHSAFFDLSDKPPAIIATLFILRTKTWLKAQIREQMSGPDLHVFTIKFLALQRIVFSPYKILHKIDLTFVYLYSRQLFSADPKMCSKKFK